MFAVVKTAGFAAVTPGQAIPSSGTPLYTITIIQGSTNVDTLYPGDDGACALHPCDLGSGFSDDHAGTCSKARWISANTSFSLRFPWIGTRFPRVR